jgi:hypothetical protein
MNKVNRSQALINSGKARAAISAFFANNPEERYAAEQVHANCVPTMHDIGYDHHQVRGILNAMVGNGQLTKEKEGRSVLYSLIAPATKPAKQPKAPRSVANNLPPNVKLQFVKSTGNLRVQFNGLVFEIGAVDE